MADEKSKPSYYAILPAKVRYDTELRPNAKLLYAEITALANSKGYCWMVNGEFAENFGLDKKSVSRLISQLADKDYITVDIIRDPVTKKVTQRRIWVDTPPHRKKEDTPSPQKSGAPVDKKAETPHHQKAEENNTSSLSNIPPISPTGDVPDGVLFENFWAAYPVHKNKDRASRAWKKLKPDMALCRKMGAALKAQKASEDWQRDNGKYIPHAATWLNGKRWEDEVETHAIAPSGPEAAPHNWGWE